MRKMCFLQNIFILLVLNLHHFARMQNVLWTPQFHTFLHQLEYHSVFRQKVKGSILTALKEHLLGMTGTAVAQNFYHG